VPKEAVILQLCELFHCRPSELDSEDGLLLLNMMSIKRWRDVALRYDDDPSTNLITSEEKRRLTYLSMGVQDALSADLEDITKETLMAVDPKDIWSYGEAKKAEIKASASLLKGKLRGETV